MKTRVIRRLIMGAMVVCILAPATAALAETEMGWSKAIYVRNKDKGYDIKFGGRIQNDWIWNNADDDMNDAISGIENGIKFRRVRLYSSGTVFYNVFYKFQLDFAGGDADFKDMFIGVKNIPLIYSVLVGHQYEPAGLETITSSKYITFLERAAVSTLMPERHTGINAFRTFPGGKVTAALGAFQNSNSYGDAGGDVWAVTGRLAWAPILEDKGKKLLHIGGSFSNREAEDGVFILKSRPENPIVPSILDTDTIFADKYNVLGGEAAFTWGPFSTQGEYAISQVTNALNEDSVAVGDPVFHAFYVQASYFLTGEHRGYKYGKHSGVKVNKPYTGQEGGGGGAWEIAARYSVLDLNDGEVQGGEFSTVTLGVNWYLNDVFRIMFDYAYVDYTDVGTMNNIGVRFSLFF